MDSRHFPNRPGEKFAENSGFEEITHLFAEFSKIRMLNSPKTDASVLQQGVCKCT